MKYTTLLFDADDTCATGTRASLKYARNDMAEILEGANSEQTEQDFGKPTTETLRFKKLRVSCVPMFFRECLRGFLWLVGLRRSFVG